VIATGAPLADFEIDANAPQRAEAHSTGHHAAPAVTAAPAPPASVERPDTGTVVGEMQTSDRVVAEAAVAVGGVKAVPAVRALAKKLGVDLSQVPPSGAGGVVTLKDVRDFAASAQAGATKKFASPLPPGEVGARSATGEGQAPPPVVTLETGAAIPSSALRAPSPGGRREANIAGVPEQLIGVRRNMARVMADALSKVVPTTLNDDADIHVWRAGEDVSVRLLRAITAACKAVPALNAWFDGENLMRTLHERVDVGIVSHIEGTRCPRSHRDAKERGESSGKVDGPRCQHQPDNTGEQHERHHTRFEQREIVSHRREICIREGYRFRPFSNRVHALLLGSQIQ